MAREQTRAQALGVKTGRLLGASARKLQRAEALIAEVSAMFCDVDGGMEQDAEAMVREIEKLRVEGLAAAREALSEPWGGY